MKWLNSIKSKVTLLLLFTVVSSLFLAATLFINRLSALQQSETQSLLSHANEQIIQEFKNREKQLSTVMQALIKEDELLASLNLIINYEDKKNYEALIFDPPKQEIARLLAQYAANVSLDIAVIYDDELTPITFYLPSESGPITGYFQYLLGKPRMMTMHGNIGLRPPILLDKLQPQDVKDSLGTANLRASNDGTLFFDMFTSIDEELFDNKVSKPLLRVGMIVDHELIESLAARTEVGVQLSFRNSVITSKGIPSIPALRKFTQVSIDDFNQELIRSTILWDEFTSRGAHYIRGINHLNIVGRELAQLSFIKDSQSLNYGVLAMKETILFFMPLIVLLVVPIGLLFANRTISIPVKQLANFSTLLAKGKYGKVDVSSRCELGQLAASFNLMSNNMRNREVELKESHAQFKGIIDNAPAAIYMKSIEGQYQVINSGFKSFLNKNEAGILGATDFELFPKELAEKFMSEDKQIFMTKKPIDFEGDFERYDGKQRTYHSVKFPIINDEGSIIALCGIATDISEKKSIEKSLTLAKQVIDNANEAIVITDTKGIIVEINEAYEQITGYKKEDVIGKNPRFNQSGRHDESFYKAMWQEIHTKGHWEGEIWDRRKNGDIYPKWLSITTVKSDEATHYVGIFSDITNKKNTEQELENLAYYDPLTNLPNRSYFNEQLKRELSIAKREKKKLALFFLDLDRFKYVNDMLGHSSGDELLVMVSRRLEKLLRETDTISRLGGDEFTMIMSNFNDVNYLGNIAQKIVDCIAKPFEVAGAKIHIGTSIGISVYPDDANDIETLVKASDLAMYQVKDSGKNGYHFYSEGMQERLSQRMKLEESIRKAIANEEFKLFYQPKVNIKSRMITGMEALIRWPQLDGSMISPAEFIPIAEETGMIIELGKWILLTACQQTETLNRQLNLDLKVAVNLSARQFQDKSILDTIATALDETGLNKNNLELEITESMTMDNINTSIDTMKMLQSYGVSLAMDDFGTGYSSMNFLKKFPIQTLKIDQSFIRELKINSQDASIVQAIITMAHALNMKVVAEGVETKEQLCFLNQVECEEVQGFYLYKPMNTSSFHELVSSTTSVAL